MKYLHVAIMFAIHSSIHSFLVNNYAKADKVAVSVGFHGLIDYLDIVKKRLGTTTSFTEEHLPLSNLSLPVIGFLGQQDCLQQLYPKQQLQEDQYQGNWCHHMLTNL